MRYIYTFSRYERYIYTFSRYEIYIHGTGARHLVDMRYIYI